MSAPTPSAEEEFIRLYGEDAWRDWQRLLTHLEFSEGFALFVVLLPGAMGLDLCRRQLEDLLSAKGRELINLSCEWKNDVHQLAERILATKTRPNTGAIWLSGFRSQRDPEIEDWRQAWARGLARLNRNRNRLRDHLTCPLIVAGPPWLQEVMREAAPDVWSVRAAVVRVSPTPPSQQTSDGEMIEFTDTFRDGEAAIDSDYALELAERLSDQPGREAERAELLRRAGWGFYHHARFAAAEAAFRESVDLLSMAANGKALSVQPDLAASLHGLGAAHAKVGHRETALDVTRQSVDIYRHLAEQQPDAFFPSLAGSLNNLANRLGALGRHEDALLAAQEAADIRHQLAEQRPDAFLPDVARSLSNLANRLSALGRRKDALAVAQQAVEILRQIAKKRPDRFVPDLATSLNNLAKFLSELGRHEDALQAAQEAIEFRRQLAEQRPDAFLPDLAMSLNNLTKYLSELGRRTDALSVAQQAVDIYRRLAEQRTDVFLPDLAMSLNNLANCMSRLGQCEGAIAVAQQAIDINRQLAEQRPDAFVPDLARSRGAMGQVMRGMKRWSEAATSFAQGIRELTPAFRALPSAFAPLMDALVRDYLTSAKKAEVEVDGELVGPILEWFQQQKTDNDEENP